MYWVVNVTSSVEREGAVLEDAQTATEYGCDRLEETVMAIVFLLEFACALRFPIRPASLQKVHRQTT